METCSQIFMFFLCLLWVSCYFVSLALTEDSCQTFIRNPPCNPDLCSKVTCPPLEGCDSGHTVEKSSQCGCCSACVVYLDENEPCPSAEVSDDGSPKRSRCKHGLSCQDGFCKFDEINTSCLTHVKHRKNILDYTEGDIQIYSRDLWIPKCDNRGLFQTKQCKKKKCFCVDEDGERLYGQVERDLAQNMTCGCSRDMRLLQKTNPDVWMTKPQHHCSREGNYDTLQCLDDICYCAHPITGEVVGTVTKMAFMDILPCYDPKKHNKLYKTQCEKQLMRARSLVYWFKQKGMHIIGLEDVRCDVDGSFAPKQCQTDRCVCTDRSGVSIKSYGVETKETRLIAKMMCRCARDEHDREAFHARYPRMICDGIGSYEPHQCFDGKCYCVDEDGDVIVDNIPLLEQEITVSLRDYCLYRLSQLNNVQSKLQPPPLSSDSPQTTDDDYSSYSYD